MNRRHTIRHEWCLEKGWFTFLPTFKFIDGGFRLAKKKLPQWLEEDGGERGPCNLSLPDWFWPLIDQIRARPKQAEKLIGDLPHKQLRQFYYAYREAVEELYGDYEDEERGWGDEDIRYASCWVLNKGEKYYLEVWSDLSLYPNAAKVQGEDYSAIAANIAWVKHKEELHG